MSAAYPLPRHLRPRRPKVFSDGCQKPIDRNVQARLMHMAKAARKAGKITRAAVEILHALLFDFANLKDGRCIPGYEKIAAAAGCHARTVGRCLPDLESAGLISFVNRIRRAREAVAGLGDIGASVWRVMRTSNSYSFPSRLPHEGHSAPGTRIQKLSLPTKAPSPALPVAETPVTTALDRLRAAMAARMSGAPTAPLCAKGQRRA